MTSAFAKLRTERPELELILVTKPIVGGRTQRLLDELSIRDHVRFVHGISDAELVALMGSAEVACVPSLYGDRDSARGVPGRGDPRGGRARRTVRRPGHPG